MFNECECLDVYTLSPDVLQTPHKLHNLPNPIEFNNLTNNVGVRLFRYQGWGTSPGQGSYAGYGTPSGPGSYQGWGAPPGPQGPPPQWGSNYQQHPPQTQGYGSYGKNTLHH